MEAPDVAMVRDDCVSGRVIKFSERPTTGCRDCGEREPGKLPGDVWSTVVAVVAVARHRAGSAGLSQGPAIVSRFSRPKITGNVICGNEIWLDVTFVSLSPRRSSSIVRTAQRGFSRKVKVV